MIEKVRLGDIAPIKQGNANRNSKSVWLLNLDMVESETGNIIEYQYVSPSEIGASTCQFDINNVLYSKLRPYLNKVVLPTKAGFATSEMLPLKPDASKLNREYLTYYLRSPSFVTYISDKVAGAKMPRARTEDLQNAKLPLPSLSKQEVIVKIFDKVINLISLRKQQLAKLDELVKSQFIEMFGDPVINPMGWPIKDLNVVCDVRDGTHDSPSYVASGYPLVTSKNVVDGKLDLSNVNYISEADYIEINKRSRVDMGDIIMPMIGTIGKPLIIIEEPSFAIKNVALIKFNRTGISNIYIQQLLSLSSFLESAIIAKSKGITQKFIALGDIRKLQIPIPMQNLQDKFEFFVQQVDKPKFEIQKSLDKLETLKKALMQQYFG